MSLSQVLGLTPKGRKVFVVFLVCVLFVSSVFMAFRVGAQVAGDVALGGATNNFYGGIYASGNGVFGGNLTASNVEMAYPAQPYSYMVFPFAIGATTYYAAKAANGTIMNSWTSTNPVAVINNTIIGSNNGDSIKVKAGNYNFGAGEKIVNSGKNNITLLAEKGTILNCTSATANPIYLTNIYGWLIDGFEIDGNSYESDAHYGVYIENGTDCTVQNVYSHNFNFTTTTAWGIYLFNCDNCKVKNNIVSENEHGGIMFISCRYSDMIECEARNNVATDGASDFCLYGNSGNPVIGCNIINSKSYNSFHYGIEIYRYCEGCAATGNTVYQSQTAGIGTNSIVGGVETNFNNRIEGNTIITTNQPTDPHRGIDARGNVLVADNSIINSFDAIYVSATDNNSIITGNKIYNCSNIALKISGNFHTISNNHVFGNIGTTTYGMELTCNDSLIANNIIDNCTYGINFGAGALRNQFDSNEISGTTTANKAAGTISNTNKFETFYIPFTESNGTMVAPDDDPAGWTINSATNYAIGFGNFPLNINEVVKCSIVGMAKDADADGMMLHVKMWTGLDNGAATKRIDDEYISSLNFASSDFIIWAMPTYEMGFITAGTYFYFKVYYNAASGANIATNALLQGITIEYL